MHNPVSIGVVGSYSYRSISTTLEIIDVCLSTQSCYLPHIAAANVS